MTAAAPAAASPALCDLLRAQTVLFGGGEAALASVEALRKGARAVVTGQQAGLFGGPLLTLLKAATAVARARQATARTGVPHVPVFWVATEDHDLDEVDRATVAGRSTLETLSLHLRSHGEEVGGIALGSGVVPLLGQLESVLSGGDGGPGPALDLLRDCYTSTATLGGAFASLIARLFAPHGLIVMDASGRGFHALGAPVLRAAIERAAELEDALLARTAQLEAAGYHAQVLVKPGASLLFLLDGPHRARLPLRRLPDGTWKAGLRTLTAAALLDTLATEPERLSPNALLRPLFQDTLLPTAAYIGGPAEIAYFAQSAVLYERLLGRVTPILPRFSATLVPPPAAAAMARHELTLPDLFAAGTVDELTQRLGARSMPIEGKRRLSAAGNALDGELTALTSYMESVDAGLGRSAGVAASKMRYQMNRLRRLAARFETEKEASLRRHAETLMRQLFPDRHPQERLLGSAWALAQAGEPAELIAQMVEAAADTCPGHTMLPL